MKKEKNNLTDLTDKSNHTDNKSNHPAFLDLEKSKAHIIVEILEYVPHAVVNKIIIKKTTGSLFLSDKWGKLNFTSFYRAAKFTPMNINTHNSECNLYYPDSKRMKQRLTKQYCIKSVK